MNDSLRHNLAPRICAASISMLILLATAGTMAQVRLFDPVLPQMSDSAAIQLIISDIIQGVQARNSGSFLKYALSTPATTLQALEAETNEALLRLPVTSGYSPAISIANMDLNRAVVVLDSVQVALKRNVDGRWLIEHPTALRGLVTQLAKKNAGNSPASPPPPAPTDLTAYDLRVSKHALIPIEYDQNIWVVNKTVAQDRVRDDLFWSGNEGEMAAVGTVTTLAGFIVDTWLKRILFLGTDGQWIKSYGDASHTSEHHFVEPWAIKVKKKRLGPWYAYVADMGAHHVDKFGYDPSSHTLTFLQTFSANIVTPFDVDMDQDDGESMLVADGSRASLVKLYSDGTLKWTIENYTYGGQTYRIGLPSQVLIGPWGIGFIDMPRNSFVTVYWYQLPTPGSGNTTVPAAYVNRFNIPSSRLVSIGYLYGKCFVVADRGARAMHFFSEDGQYVASYWKFSSEWAVNPLIFAPVDEVYMFNYVRAFSSSNQADETVAQLSSYSLEEWTATSGFRRFLPGADALDLSVVQNGTSCTFNWRLTNRSNCVAMITDKKGNPLMTLVDGLRTPNRYSLTVQNSQIPGSTSYKFRVSILPENNAYYISNYQQVWATREVVFSIQAGPPPPPPDKPVNTDNDKPLPADFDLHQNYPNPSNPSTRISVDLPVAGNVTLNIFDVMGRRVASIANGHFEAGRQTFHWDGINNAGIQVASGVYLFQVDVKDENGRRKFEKTRKLVILR